MDKASTLECLSCQILLPLDIAAKWYMWRFATKVVPIDLSGSWTLHALLEMLRISG